MRHKFENKKASFSSTLLDEIYRSIDDNDGDTKCPYKDYTLQKKHHTTNNLKNNRTRVVQDDKKSNIGRKHVIFFRSSSISSDSTFGGFSSSDTESRSKSSSCFVPYFPNRLEKSKKKTESSLFNKQRESKMVDDYNHHPTSKLKSYKINYCDLKQPISPGKRLSTFISSLFFTPKKSMSCSSVISCENKLNSESTCSSNGRRERLGNGVKRNVRFCPVSLIVHEDHTRPYAHKSLYELEDKPKLVRKIDEVKLHGMEKSRKVEEMAREFLRNQKIREDNYDDDDDALSSCSSPDLFELDHLSLDNRYLEELSVYETTRIRITNCL